MTPREIAEKYVYGNHDALTNNQEIRDMIKDIESCIIEKSGLKCDCGESEDVKMIPMCACCYNPHTGEW